ncbi:hypothetical protein FRAHR75_210021 [Frankia sp. Hr75.2]|nr:hypothetical protein FRAHR75_210021 [Frankia sp. Hr75.2]
MSQGGSSPRTTRGCALRHTAQTGSEGAATNVGFALVAEMIYRWLECGVAPPQTSQCR